MRKKFITKISSILLITLVATGCGSSANVENASSQSSSTMSLASAALENTPLPEFFGLFSKDFSTKSKLTLEEAKELLDSIDASPEEIEQLEEVLNKLSSCQGIYIKDKDEDSTGTTYKAVFDIYLEYGIPRCSINYDGYMGSIESGVINWSEDSDYILEIATIGKLASTDHEFTIQIGEETACISWGEMNHYFTKGDESDLVEEEKISFVDSESYQTIIDQVDTTFSRYDTSHMFDEETDTLFYYISLGITKEKLTENAATIRDDWENVLSTLQSISEKGAEVISLEIRDGIYDFKQGHFDFWLVDQLESSNSYRSNNMLATIADGVIQYNCLDSDTSGSSKSGSSGSRSSGSDSFGTESKPDSSMTSGQKNALKQAESYLRYSAFSHKGLVEQLEYEGYSHADAVYAADHCGADWNEQAYLSAKSYLEYSSFSYSGLVEQLEYEGFTAAQAEYGAKKAY